MRQYDATCMLVEKVWKAARAYGREGYTVVIHGKHEHEETKATFSNTRRYAPAIIVQEHGGGPPARGDHPQARTPQSRSRFHALFDGEVTAGLRRRPRPGARRRRQPDHAPHERDPGDHRRTSGRLRAEVRARRPGRPARVGGPGPQRHPLLRDPGQPGRPRPRPRRAPGRGVRRRRQEFVQHLPALPPVRAAPRATGPSSSRARPTSCPRREAEHYVFPAKGRSGPGGHVERRPLWSETRAAPGARPGASSSPAGASCPDGIIQQVISRINGFYPPDSLRAVEAVLADLAEA